MTFYSYNKDQLFDLLPKRRQNSHKGTYGRLLIIGGSSGMCGAPYFSAKAAYRTGVGLVEIFSCAENRTTLQALIPEAILTVYDQNSIDPYALGASISRADAVAIGMGLSESPAALELIAYTLDKCTSPLIIDADALNLISKNKQLWTLIKAPVIITPHLAEMSRLSGWDIPSIANNIPLCAKSFADVQKVICVLKDHHTAVASPLDEKVYINQSGNSGMSTAGSGDVLDGVIGALLAQRLDPVNAASLGVFLHGLAGDVASSELSEYSVMASDIIEAIPKVLLK